ncbi:hypothetical protein CTH30272_03919 [Allocatenococcus thiocycli]|nr:hypothetical protein CTH30272_03919 [Catenococcus thiocycli]
MATITIEKVTRKTGIKYKARVRILTPDKQRLEKSKTFEKKSLAQKWAKLIEKEMMSGNTQDTIKPSSILIGDLITLYLTDPFTSKDLGRSKEAVLSRLRSYEIALIKADQITANDLVQHCRTRLCEGTKPLPQTVYQDITYLRSVLNVAGPMFGFEANTRAHDDAMPTLVKYNLVGRSNRRDRRPTEQELCRIEEALRKREQHHASHIPLVDIFHISILTCMRLGEITRITWKDLDINNQTVTIRDRKDPRRKIGNHCTIPLFKEALEIVVRQPKTKEDSRIFPYNSTSVGAAWQRVCKELKIEDLHYHDLRAEGACRLFEKGMNIVEVSKITGHRDINVLNNVYLRLGVKAVH